MRLISVSIICLVTIVGVQAVDWKKLECKLDVCSTDDGALMEASAFLENEGVDMYDRKANFDRASEVLLEIRDAKRKADPDVVAILQTFLNLKSMSADHFDCTLAEYDKLMKMKKLVSEHSTEAERNRGGSRIRFLFDCIQLSFFETCSKRIKEGLAISRLADPEINKLNRFKIFVEKVYRNDAAYLRAVNSKGYMDQLGVTEHWLKLLEGLNPKEENMVSFNAFTRKYNLNEFYITELFNGLFAETCGLIDKTDYLQQNFGLGSKMLDELFSDQSMLVRFAYDDLIGDYLICQAAKNYDYLRLLKMDYEEKHRT